MTPGIDNNEILLSGGVWVLPRLNGNKFDVLPTQGGAESGNFELDGRNGEEYLFDGVELGIEESCGVRDACSKVYLIVLMLKRIDEGQVEEVGVCFHPVFVYELLAVVLHVFAGRSPVPPISAAADVGSHAALVERVSLAEAVDVEPNFEFLAVFD